MTTIRLKLPVYSFKAGFDICNRPTTSEAAKAFVRLMQFNGGCRETLLVYHMQKFNKKTIKTVEMTSTGRPKKKLKVEVIPTHWEVTVYKIPPDVVSLLKANKKKIIQHKHHWEIK